MRRKLPGGSGAVRRGGQPLRHGALPIPQRPASQPVCGRRPLLLLCLRGTRGCDRLCGQAVSAFALRCSAEADGRFSSQPGQAAQRSSTPRKAHPNRSTAAHGKRAAVLLFCRITPVCCGIGRCGMRQNRLPIPFIPGMWKPATNSTGQSITWIFCVPGIPMNVPKSFSSRWRTANWTGCGSA